MVRRLSWGNGCPAEFADADKLFWVDLDNDPVIGR
jgi:hypothetical protein